MKSSKYPTWWDRSIDFAWDHIKVAMKQDWNRLKNSLRKTTKPTDPEGIDRIQPANGINTLLLSDHTMFDELESAFRFGYSAHLEYDMEWNDNLEISLAKEWRAMNPLREETWEHDRQAILYGWHFDMETDESAATPTVHQRAQLSSSYFDLQVSQGDMIAA